MRYLVLIMLVLFSFKSYAWEDSMDTYRKNEQERVMKVLEKNGLVADGAGATIILPKSEVGIKPVYASGGGAIIVVVPDDMSISDLKEAIESTDK